MECTVHAAGVDTKHNFTADGASYAAADFEEIFDMHFRRVYNFISYRINNHHDTEELTSQVFEKAIARYASYDMCSGPIEAWIIGIAKNVVNDYFRKRKRRVILSLDAITAFKPITDQDKPDDLVVKNEENLALMKALQVLNQKERTIVAMKYAARLKNKDIARNMGLSETNVGTILFRSLNKMRKELEKGVTI